MNTLDHTPQKRYLSKTHKVVLYLFLGCGFATLAIIGLTLLGYLYGFLFNNEAFTTVKSPFYGFLILSIIFYYPAALIIGGIPAVLTGIVINELTITNHKKSDAFIIGFVVSFIFYSSCYYLAGESVDQSILTASSLSLIGGFAAACTMNSIQKKEAKLL